jgi:DNA helicase-2/ATP-dependent DNA helicase PcrA
MDHLARWAQKLNRSPYQILQLLKTTDDTALIPSDAFDARSRKSLGAFVNLLDAVIAAKADRKLSELVEFILQKIAYEDYIVDGTSEAEDRWGNVIELQRATKKYSDDAAETTLAPFLEEVALVADIDSMREDTNVPTLMTLHTAKGLEFRAVFIAGLEEGLFPHSRSFDDPAQMEEERRLCYVGITRAKERLYLLHTFRRAFYGNSEASEPSRYLADIPRQLIAGNARTSRAKTWDDDRPSTSRRSTFRAQVRRDDIDDFEIEKPPRPRRAPAIDSSRRPVADDRKFNAGDRVRHATFGDGVVVASKIVGADEEVQVAFERAGVKRLIARYADLKTR